MTKVKSLTIGGMEDADIELPRVFDTPYRRDLIHKAYTNLNTHKFQPKGTHPTAGMDVSADSLDPPTGHGRSRVARMKGGGGGRGGQAGEVASVRGGRQAHPPKAEKVIHKKMNKKENRLALCSAIAATASRKLVESRGHKVGRIREFPVVISDEIETVSKARQMQKIIDDLNLTDDIDRLKKRKARTGKSALRGRPKKIGTSVLFVARSAGELSKAVGGFSGVEARSARDLSVLDLAPGSDPIRLTVYSRGAIEEIAKIKSPHLELIKP